MFHVLIFILLDKREMTTTATTRNDEKNAIYVIVVGWLVGWLVRERPQNVIYVHTTMLVKLMPAVTK